MSYSLQLIAYGFIVFILWTIFGSFGGVLIERLADSCNRKTIRSILTGRSICPACPDQREFARYELIPIVSRLRQWGRCTRCASPIPQRYLRLEIASGLVFVMTYLRGAHYWLALTEVVRRLVINWLLLLILIYDLQTQYLHTPLWYMLIAVIVGYLLTHTPLLSLWIPLVPAAIWTALIWLIWRSASIYARRRYGQSEGIGSGDVIIIATISPLLLTVAHITWFDQREMRSFYTLQSFFYMLIIASIVSLFIAALTHKNKAGQTLAFLPWLIIAWRILTRIAPRATQ